MGEGVEGLRIAILVKQVPRFEVMELDADGRLVRDGVELEMNPYCRRAVSAGVTLAESTGGTTTVFSVRRLRDWTEVVPLLTAALEVERAGAGAGA